MKLLILGLSVSLLMSCAASQIPKNSNSENSTLERTRSDSNVRKNTTNESSDKSDYLVYASSLQCLIDEQENIFSDEDFNTYLAEQTPDNVWDELLELYQFDLSEHNPRIEAQLQWYKKHQSYMNRVSDRGNRYLYYITQQIKKRNLPGELALLPIVESAFEPFAYSHGRAAGVWQFIPSTGVMYKMKQDWWYDGRRDIRVSTEGALNFLEDLNRQFNGDWLLGFAAYNSGAGTVRRAIRKNKRRGKPTDFWSLDLPKETRAYVPKLIALAKLLRDAKEHNFTFKPIPNQPYFYVAQTKGQIDLSQVAELSDTPLDEIYKLNPGFNRWATHPNGPHEVLIPFKKQDEFNQAISSLKKQNRVKWTRYKVRSGDNLISIAKKFRTTPKVLQQVNNLRSGMIYQNDQLLIPSAFKGKRAYSHSQSQRLAKLKTNRRPSSKSVKMNYRVKSGDSFWTISRNYKVSVRSLARWNGMAPRDPLKVGQNLVIWGKAGNRSSSGREIIRKVRYRVRSGDSLASIASKFRVRLSDVKRWNSSKARSRYLQPGDKLTLFVNVIR